jgi:hypothetical protein
MARKNPRNIIVTSDVVGRLIGLLPGASPFGLPVSVARIPAAPLCETLACTQRRRWRLTQTPYNVANTCCTHTRPGAAKAGQLMNEWATQWDLVFTLMTLELGLVPLPLYARNR